MENQSLFQDERKRSTAWDGIELLVKEAHRNAVAHGFYDQVERNASVLRQCDADLGEGYLRDFNLSQLAKIGEECGEACHALRKGDDAGFIEELADICIRVFDLAGHCTFPDIFAHALISKMDKNVKRDRLHGMKC